MSNSRKISTADLHENNHSELSKNDETPLGVGQDNIYVISEHHGAGYTCDNSLSYGTNNYYCSDDIWSTNADGELLCLARRAGNRSTDAAKYLFIDVMLPSGFLMPVQCPALRTLAQLKQDVYIQAKKLPPSTRITDVSDYIFATIGLNGVRVELYDEQKSVSALCISCLPVFELIQPKGNVEEKTITQKISTVIGFSISEIERQICEELMEFRLELFEICQKATAERGVEGRSHYAFYLESMVIPLVMKPTNFVRDEREVNESDIDCVEYPENPAEIRRRSLDYLRGRMDVMETYIEVWWCSPSSEANNDASYTHSVRLKDIFGRTSVDIIGMALESFRNITDVPPEDSTTDYILQIAGQRVFIDDPDTEITYFKYIRSSMKNCRMSHLLLRKRSVVFQQYKRPPPLFEPAFSRRQEQDQRLRLASEFCEQKYHSGQSHSNNADAMKKSFWDLDENLRIRLHSLSQIGVSAEDKIFIRVGVAVGRHLLDVQQTILIESTKSRFMENGLLEFGVYVKDVPECAHFSFTLICVRGAARATSSTALSRLGKGEPLGWANYNLFDWRHQLHKGKQTISLRPFPKELEQETASAKELNLYLSGAIHSPSVGEAIARLEVELDDYKDSRAIRYEFPSDATIFRFNGVLEERRLALEFELGVILPSTNDFADSQQQTRERDAKMKQLETVMMQEKLRMKKIVLDNAAQITNGNDFDSDDENRTDEGIDDLPFRGLLVPDCKEFRRLYCLHRCLDASHLGSGDQRFLWRMRYKLREHFPQLITLLADCAHVWCDRERTCEFYALLRDWPQLHVETAIELLDGRYTDRRLRRLAVQNLDRALSTDDDLCLHLLTLVQSVRYEPYASSPLALMLTRRSILSYRIAHTVFWLLRAELAHLLSHNNSSAKKLSFLYMRYALMLEAICRANTLHLDSTIKQVEMVSQLTYMSTMIRNMGGNKDAATKKLQQELEAKKELLQFMDSPLNPIDQLGELIVKDCRVLGSAKMPLRLTWRNPEPKSMLNAATHQLLFKNGDDMRQDMLTIQVMRIMDSKWKSHDCDYCMTLYDVLPMGRNIGLIQVVQNCRTLFEIQCEAGPVASSLNMDTNMLHKFLYRNYDKSNHYVERVERFTASLAGYCIATFVIGIRDRHQDNIMIADDGRIFHIDFGHFLGHTKRKLGINRERTDFILTEHFLSAISHCKDYRKSHEFALFREKCIKGFMIVYDHARFYIVLFRMMLCMGLPELSSLANVNFLRDTLLYAETEREKVRDAFQSTFDQAIRGDWSVSVNWFFHSVKHM